MPPARSQKFPRTHRLSGRAAFSAVYAARARQSRGPLTSATTPNSLPHGRWGLSVPRAVGNAVARNRVKRLLREAIRLGQAGWPAGYDAVIVVRPHRAMSLVEYGQFLAELLAKSHKHWQAKG